MTRKGWGGATQKVKFKLHFNGHFPNTTPSLIKHIVFLKLFSNVLQQKKNLFCKFHQKVSHTKNAEDH